MSSSNKKKAEDRNQNNRARNLLTINFLGSSESEVRLVRHLKHVKAKTGLEIKVQILRAALILNDLYAIGEDPASTRAEFEDAMLNFLIELTSQLSRGLNYGKNHPYNIESPPTGWKQFCLIADSLFPTGSFTERKNNGGSDDLPKSQGLTEDEEDEEQDEEDLSDLSDEEYMKIMQSRIDNPQVKK